MQDKSNTAYYAKPDEAFWDTPAVSKDEIEIVETEPRSDAFPNNGRFKKGHDPRRHEFTRDECVKGFWAAIESIVTRYPDAIMPDGRHIVCNFLRTRPTTEEAF